MPNLNKILTDIDPEKEIVVRERDHVWVADSKNFRLKRVFVRIGQTKGWKEVELGPIIATIVEKLTPAMRANTEEFLKELLFNRDPEEILEVAERLKDPKAAIKPAPGECFSLKIGGKRGRPYELVLVK